MTNVENINCEEACKLMTENIDYLLIDVRTTAEWQKIGIPKTPKTNATFSSKILLLSWRILPDMIINDQFLASLTANTSNKSTNLLFICRSGVRSHEAAVYAKMAGYKNCYNIIDGFEGNKTGLGWKSSNLPWEFLEGNF